MSATRLAPLAALLVVLLAWPAVAGQPPVSVTCRPEYGEVQYTLTDNGCRHTLVLYSTQINAHVIQYRPDCLLAPRQQATIVSRLLARLLADAPAPTTLFWGRLYAERTGNSSAMGLRLAKAACGWPGWDAAAGKPRNGNVNDAVVACLNAASAFSELQTALAPLGLSVSVSGAEKVIVKQARSLAFYDKLAPCGVDPSHRLPVDALVWLRLTPQAAPSNEKDAP